MTEPAQPAMTCTGYLFALAQDGLLGQVGDSLLVPADQVILPTVFSHGCWQPEEIRFFADRLDGQRLYTLLDIGANIGLFSRQMTRVFPQIARLYCFEPSPLNFAALRFNLAPRGDRPDCHFINAALDTEDGVRRFFQDHRNIGNHSLNEGAMHDASGYDEKQVQVLSVAGWLDTHLSPDERLIWKSDTQGFDERIISAVPWAHWRRIDCAIVEVWRISKPTLDWDAFAARIEDFPNRSLGIGNPVSTDAVLDYLRGQDGAHTDLYLWR
ncbi:FkbM family methyltransferase [Acidisoma sp. 7E03]